MANFSKGICLTNEKDIFKLGPLIEKAISSVLKKNKNPNKRIDQENRLKRTEVSFSNKMITFNFTHEGNKRFMHLFLDCDCGYQELGDKKIIFSLGNFGISHEIIVACCEALSSLGNVYHILDDYRDEGWVQLNYIPQGAV